MRRLPHAFPGEQDVPKSILEDVCLRHGVLPAVQDGG